MKEYAATFYKSQAWAKCRAAYAASVWGLCERCAAAGQIKAGEIVHHKIHITPENINNPEITLNWDNLELVCRDCHAALHSGRVLRYQVDDLGRVIFSGEG